MLKGRAMSGPEIVRFVKRNAYRPDVVAAHWHRSAGRLHDFAICVANPMKGFAYKVSIGDVPEETIEDPATGRIIVRGWRGLFKQMLCDGVIKESAEVCALLGQSEVDMLKNVNRGFSIDAQAHELA